MLTLFYLRVIAGPFGGSNVVYNDPCTKNVPRTRPHWLIEIHVVYALDYSTGNLLCYWNVWYVSSALVVTVAIDELLTVSFRRLKTIMGWRTFGLITGGVLS